MAGDLLTSFMGVAARAKVLRAFVLAEPEPLTAGQAAKRSGVSTATAVEEIKTLLQWGILKKTKFSILTGGKRVVADKQNEEAWSTDPDFPYAVAVSRFVHELSPVLREVILPAFRGVGKLSAVILSGSFLGDMSRPADIVIIADSFNEERLESAMKSLEPQVGRELRYAAFSTPEFRYRLTIQDRLVRDTLDFPHIVLLDKANLL